MEKVLTFDAFLVYNLQGFVQQRATVLCSFNQLFHPIAF